MKYREYSIEILSSGTLPTEVSMEILQQYLADNGFESFSDKEDGSLLAYCPSSLSHAEAVRTAIETPPLNELMFSIASREMDDINWNEEWEKNFFRPIQVADCTIFAPFHHLDHTPQLPLMIQPQMAFGTGHHDTTAGMIRLLSEMQLSELSVTDMGCGSGILGIYCLLKGAKDVLAIDVDDWCYRNTLENARLNEVDLTARLGDASLLSQVRPADVFLANINRNIILADLDAYVQAMKPSAHLLLSGFLEQDLDLVSEALAAKSLKIDKKVCSNHWLALQARKEDA